MGSSHLMFPSLVLSFISLSPEPSYEPTSARAAVQHDISEVSDVCSSSQVKTHGAITISVAGRSSGSNVTLRRFADGGRNLSSFPAEFGSGDVTPTRSYSMFKSDLRTRV